MKISRRRKWQSAMLTDIAGWDVAGSGVLGTHDDRAASILKGATYATLFAYLWRRFGPPTSGWDPDKELVNYFLTTPVRGVGFGLSCAPSGLPCGCFYALSPTMSARINEWERGATMQWLQGLSNHCLCEDLFVCAEMMRFARGHMAYNCITATTPVFQAQVRRLVREYEERVGPCPRRRWVNERIGEGTYGEPAPIEVLPRSPHRVALAAIEEGLRDLLRPVPVRGTYINACGIVADGKVKRAVNPSSRAGCGCSPQFIDMGADWWNVVRAIEKLGMQEALRRLA